MDSMPRCYQVLTNLDCNLSCTYCYEQKGRGANCAQDIRDYLAAMYERDFGAQDADRDREVFLEFIGGETLLYPELLDDACAFAVKLEKFYGVTRPFTAGISTNGTLVTTPQVQEFLLRTHCLEKTTPPHRDA